MRCGIVVFPDHTHLPLNILELLLSPLYISSLSNLLYLEDRNNYLTLDIDLGVKVI